MPAAKVGLYSTEYRVTLHAIRDTVVYIGITAAVNHRRGRRRWPPPRLTDPDVGLKVSHIGSVAPLAP